MNTALLSYCREYRYRLTRELTCSLMHPQPVIAFVMLNPSTADAHEDDPTIRRCVAFAVRENARQLIVGNLFGLRATDPRAIYTRPEPVGAGNDEALGEIAKDADLIIAAWGSHGDRSPQRVEAVREILGPGLRCLGVTKAGQPRHPLYLKRDAELMPYPHERAGGEGVTR